MTDDSIDNNSVELKSANAIAQLTGMYGTIIQNVLNKAESQVQRVSLAHAQTNRELMATRAKLATMTDWATRLEAALNAAGLDVPKMKLNSSEPVLPSNIAAASAE